VNRSDGHAELTTHGHDGDKNMKVPWWIDGGGPSLELLGTRLDGTGSFSQEFPEALSPKGVYPTIVDIPAAGCWVFIFALAGAPASSSSARSTGGARILGA